MKPRWLHLLLFVVLLLAVIAILRSTFHTAPGWSALAVICVVRLLLFLYRLMRALVIALWNLSAGIVESIQESRARRVSGKEAPDAARLL
jgi:ABC-type methionine transport system permease subunit